MKIGSGDRLKAESAGLVPTDHSISRNARVLKMLREGPMTASAITKRLNVSRDEAHDTIKSLCNQNKIERVGFVAREAGHGGPQNIPLWGLKQA